VVIVFFSDVHETQWVPTREKFGIVSSPKMGSSKVHPFVMTLRNLRIKSPQKIQVVARWFQTSRIIPLSKWLGTPQLYAMNGHLQGEQPYSGDLLSMVMSPTY